MAITLNLFISALILFQLCSCQQQLHNHTIYHLIPDYSTYIDKFAQIAGPKNTIQMTKFGTGKQICTNRQACRFFVYLYQPQSLNPSQVKNTILITSGMHGNELIGPTTLLYLFPLLHPQNTRILYFPICNPSGYDKKQRETYPNEISLNRDYPIDKNTDCYRGSSTRIIDQLFRKYRIDLTLNLHNGGDQIGWNWGTKYNQKFPQTDDEAVYRDIGEMLRFYGGYNRKLGIKEFKIGTMSQTIYPAVGTLDDWAYAGSWTESAQYKCQQYQFEPYPKQMHQGLVFLFELGQHNAPQSMLGTSQGLDQSSTSVSSANGYVSRAIRMLRQVIKVLDPEISFHLVENTLFIKIEGCNTVESLTITFSEQSENITKDHRIQPVNIKSLTHSFSHITQLKLSKPRHELQLSYTVECDKNWQQKGHTKFSKQRIFSETISIKSEKNFKQDKFKRVNGEQISKNIILFWIYIMIPIVLFIVIVYRFKARTNRKQKENKNVVSKQDRSKNRDGEDRKYQVQISNDSNQNTEEYMEVDAQLSNQIDQN